MARRTPYCKPCGRIEGSGQPQSTASSATGPSRQDCTDFGNLAALRSVVLIRDCQPLPYRRKCASTSRSSRNETSCLVGAFCRPRPRRTHCTRSGTTAAAGRKRAKSASVNSGLSASFAAAAVTTRSSFLLNRTSLFDFFLRELFISPHLPIIGLAQTDDSNFSSTAREYHHVKPRPDLAERNHSGFAISPSKIRRDTRRFPIETFRRCEIDTVLGEVGSTFRLIPNI